MGSIAIEGYVAIYASADGSPMSAVMKINTQPLNDIMVTAGAIQGKVYGGNMSVTVKSGTVNGWSLVSPVTITIIPTIIQNSKVDGLAPLTEGDSGSAQGTFKMGDSTTTKTITLTISDSGQDKVDMI